MKNLVWLQKYSKFWFWLTVLGANFLLFVPLFALTTSRSVLFPRLTYHTLLQRSNYDPWRGALEWLLVVAVGVNLRWLAPVHRRRWYRWFAFAVLVLFLVYQVYAAVDVALYHNMPNFYNDWTFLGGGLGFVLDSLPVPWWMWPLGVAGVALAAGGLYVLVSVPLVWTAPERLGRATRWGIVALAGVALAYVVLFPAQAARPEGEVASLSLKLVANIRRSRQTLAQVRAMQEVSPYQEYNYSRYPLAERPNVYLLFLESYGSVLVTDPGFQPAYRRLMDEVETTLTQAGWHMATGLSRSPVWGGGSWMAYTTVLTGVRIAQQPQYLALKYAFQRIPYPHLGRYLQSQGYRFTWVVPIDRQLPANIWAANRRFYGPDAWITFSDLHYHGPEYSWGPSPPDQYVLGFLRDWLQKQPPKPNFILYLTQNTHYPFAPVPPWVEDWRQLNDPSIDHPDQRPFKGSRRQAYLQAVTYDWHVLSDFIRQAGPHDVFILIGDHQPPAVSGPWDGYETIMHVISRDEAFVRRFTAYGLQMGMWPDTATPPLRHEGLYSLIVRQLVAQWGAHPDVLPAYHPEGIRLPGILPKVRSIYHKAQKFKPREKP